MNLWSENKLRLIITSDCNIACFYCHNEGQPKTKHYMSDVLLDSICQLVELNNEDLETITLTGGEPLLHPSIESFIYKLRRHCEKITLVTNGYLINKSKLDLLVNSGVTKIRIGVDSLKNQKPRPAKGPKPNIPVIDIIDMILDKGINLEMNVVLTKFNKKEFPNLVEFCTSQGISAKFFEHVKVLNFGKRDNEGDMKSKPYVEFKQFHEELISKFPDAEHGYAPGFGIANYRYDIKGSIIRYCRYLCPYGLCSKTGTRIDPWGNVYVCMKNRGQIHLHPSEPLKVWANKIQTVLRNGCNNPWNDK